MLYDNDNDDNNGNNDNGDDNSDNSLKLSYDDDEVMIVIVMKIIMVRM